MAGMRVTQRTIATNSLNSLQANMARLAVTQQQMASGKQLTRASDNPTGAVAAMQVRGDISAAQQYSRNADDGLGWLDAAETALGSTSDSLNRARDLVLQGSSSGSGSSAAAREALAVEIDGIRDAVLAAANSKYLGRPVFGGTTDSDVAYDASGAYTGDPGDTGAADDPGRVERTVGNGSKVRVDVSGPGVYGVGDQQLLTVLSNISDHLRTDPSALTGDIEKLDIAATSIQSGLSSIGARYNQLDQMRQSATDRILDMRTQLSNVEDIDLPKTITELSLQETAYQAALAATAKVIQPSLVDFLR